MKIDQSRERKEASRRYCKIHKIYYFENCPFCDRDQRLLTVTGVAT